jgi:hypothetical protein
MLLTITITHQPTIDLGFLLHKQPIGSSRSTCVSGGPITGEVLKVLEAAGAKRN